ncbi:MAG TPA: ABC transporter permease subunit [Dehalococcoidia bacterium]|nr:ABC transporter permease subunit [Dehalococcoidia bacterium]
MRNVVSFTGNVLAIMIKELRTYFTSPLAYITTAIFLLVSGFLFVIVVNAQQNATMAARDLGFNIGIVMLFFAPALTMRLIAEEKRVGTIEMLLTAPVRDTEVVIGKFLGALTLLIAMLALTLYYPLFLTFLGDPDRGGLIALYGGLVLLGGLFIAIGLFASSLTQNQVVAAVFCFVLLLIFWIGSSAGPFLPTGLSDIVKYLGVIEHFVDFTKGIVSIDHVVYYITGIILFLFLTIRSLESRTWL